MTEAVRDLREGGSWTLAQRAKNDVLFLLVEASLATLGRLPPGALRVAGRALGVLARTLVPAARRTAERNVALAFPELDEAARHALVARAYRTLGECLGDAVSMLDPRREVPPLPFAPGARETLDRAVASGRGVVLASAHLGPWERVAGTLASAGFPFTAVAREAYDPRLTRLYHRLRGGRGVATIYRGAPGSGAALLRALRRGGVLGVPMDLASRVPSVEVPFLGVPARTPVGPARLALRTGAVVVVGTAAPGSSAGDLTVAVTPVRASDLAPDAEGERVLTARINEQLSRAIRALPEAWIWMHPRFGGPPTPAAKRD